MRKVVEHRINVFWLSIRASESCVFTVTRVRLRYWCLVRGLDGWHLRSRDMATSAKATSSVYSCFLHQTLYSIGKIALAYIYSSLEYPPPLGVVKILTDSECGG